MDLEIQCEDSDLVSSAELREGIYSIWITRNIGYKKHIQEWNVHETNSGSIKINFECNVKSKEVVKSDIIIKGSNNNDFYMYRSSHLRVIRRTISQVNEVKI